MNALDQEVVQLAKTLWDFHHVHHTLKKADIIICFTSLDLSVARYVAELYKKGYAPRVVFAGNQAVSDVIPAEQNIQRTTWGMPEADKFAQEAVSHGIPRDRIWIENTSNNSGENVIKTYGLLQEKNLIPHKIIVVQKPTMERRAFATFRKQWPESDYELMVTSPRYTFEEYISQVIDANTIINIMVGDVQRIKVYSIKGFQIPQEIPAEVQAAFHELVQRGYTKHLIQEETV